MFFSLKKKKKRKEIQYLITNSIPIIVYFAFLVSMAPTLVRSQELTYLCELTGPSFERGHWVERYKRRSTFTDSY